jgi:hypothetical protein
VTVKRWVWVGSGLVCVVVGGLAFVVGLNRANQIAGIVGAIVAVIGLAPLAAGSRRGGNRRISAIGTGSVRRRGKGDHVTGVVTGRRTSADIEARDTGPIVSDGDGDATTGVRLD